MMKNNIHGILLLDKPKGISSHQALQQVRRLYCIHKAGHTGTLDVLASGLLPICFGEATKFAQYMLDADKGYHVIAQLGARTCTGDAEGEVIDQKPVRNFSLQEIEQVLDQFRGHIQQVPSMFSALKYHGVPLYKLARQGIEIERPPRNITIYALNILESKNTQLILEVYCSKGTYIRSLVDDIGQVLGCGAYVLALKRTRVGHYTEAQMVSLEVLKILRDEDNIKALHEFVIPLSEILVHLPHYFLSAADTCKLYQGQVVEDVHLTTECGHETSVLVRLFNSDQHFIGVGYIDDAHCLKSERLVAVL